MHKKVSEASPLSGSRVTSEIVLNMLFMMASSNIHHITRGVPQGFVLGLHFFLAYMNDIFNASEFLFTVLYADDTNIFVNGSNYSDF